MEQIKKAQKTIEYKCDCCGKTFTSKVERKGDKLCLDCIELRRALKGFLNRGLTKEQVLSRATKLLLHKQGQPWLR